MQDLIDMAADRGAFIDQSQSLNIFIAKPSYSNISSMHFYGWSKVRSNYLIIVHFASRSALLTEWYRLTDKKSFHDLLTVHEFSRIAGTQQVRKMIVPS